MLAYIYELIDQNQGSISISDFMNAALYHKQYGYYMCKVPLGKDGDFVTAPEISQLFGEIIAVWIMYVWEKLDKPEKFSLVELGPGKGTLISDIIRVTKKHSFFFQSMSIHLVEISPALQNIQRKTLQGLNIEWHEDMKNLPEQPTIFLANEFFDALPIDQFVYRDKKWYENRIAKHSEDGLTIKQIEKKEPVCDSVIFDDAVVEVCSCGTKMLKKIEEKICKDRGAALIVDYGYIYPSYKNTLQSIKQHRYVNFLEDVGNCDITAFVDFQALKNSLQHMNCEILTQREFLYSFGIKERAQVLIKNATNTQKKRIMNEFLRLTENMGTLFKVMLMEFL
ncbi:MAG: SAM-dependent methyltransferase [Wolbachia endosymbiont of Tyrophagus putrescentiae]|nr:SAM-dependent methyltransferase [Wolbachia endosymbiont of Tyrophagus putrescentiae]